MPDHLRYLNASFLQPSYPSLGQAKSRNVINGTSSTRYAVGPKSPLKKMPSKKSGTKSKLKPGNSSRIAIKGCCHNVNVVGTNALKPSRNNPVSKQHDKSFELVNRSFIAPLQRPLYSNAQLAPAFRPNNNKDQSQLQSLLYLLESARNKSSKLRPTTPGNKSSKPWMQKRPGLCQQKISPGRAYTPCNKSRIHRVKPKNPQEYETLSHCFLDRGGCPLLSKSIEQNSGRYIKEDPYKIVNRSRNGPTVSSKTIDVDYGKYRPIPPGYLKAEDNKRKWRKYLEESTDIGSTATNKSSLLVGKTTFGGEEKDEEDLESEERLTVIENDCDNDYDLIYKSLQGKYYQP